ncbi:unnamed protein product [Gongylonema pulchrum]|uniref:Late embryogenesis abundant protein LEA n=1 Tax=Gongylonema pulchrum TaxID=637853 RepID=A0A183DNE2_9BILA|nr:unnamed protein product [Gongylonema pulchrum]
MIGPESLKGLLSSLKESIASAAETVKEKAVDAVDIVTGGDSSPFKNQAGHSATQRASSLEGQITTGDKKHEQIVIHLRGGEIPETKEEDIRNRGAAGYKYNANGGFTGGGTTNPQTYATQAESSSEGFHEPRIGDFNAYGGVNIYTEQGEATRGAKFDDVVTRDSGLLDLGTRTHKEEEHGGVNPEEDLRPVGKQRYIKEMQQHPLGTGDRGMGMRGTGLECRGNEADKLSSEALAEAAKTEAPDTNKTEKAETVKTGMFGGTFPYVPRPYVRKFEDAEHHSTGDNIFGERIKETDQFYSNKLGKLDRERMAGGGGDTSGVRQGADFMPVRFDEQDKISRDAIHRGKDETNEKFQEAAYEARDKADEKWDQVVEKADELKDRTVDTAAQMRDLAARKAGGAAEKAEEIKEAATEKAKQAVDATARGLGTAAGTVAGTAGAAADTARSAGQSVAGKAGELKDTTVDTAVHMKDATAQKASDVAEKVREVKDATAEKTKQAADATARGVGAAAGTVAGVASAAADTARNAGRAAVDKAGEWKDTTVDTTVQMKDAAARKASDVAEKAGEIKDATVEKTGEIRDAAGEKAKQAVDATARGVGTAAGTVAGVASAAADTARNAGRAAVDKAGEWKDTTVDTTVQMKDAAARKASDVAEKAGEIKDATVEKTGEIRDAAGEKAKQAVDATARGVGTAAGTVAGAANVAADTARSAGQSVAVKAGELKDTTLDTAVQMKDAAAQKASDVAEKAGEIKDAAAEKAKHAVDATARGVGTAAGTVAGTAGSAVDTIWNVGQAAAGKVVELKDATIDTAVEMKDAAAQKASGAAQRIGEMKDAAADSVSSAASRTAEKAGELKSAAEDKASYAAHATAEGAATAAGVVVGVAGAAVDAVKDAGSAAANKATDVAARAADRAGEMKDSAIGGISSAVHRTTDKMDEVKNAAVDSVTGAKEAAVRRASEAGEKLVEMKDSAANMVVDAKDSAMEKMAGLKNVAADEAHRKKHSVEDQLKQKVSDAADKAREVKDSASEKMTEMKDLAAEKIHEGTGRVYDLKDTTSGTAHNVIGRGILTTPPSYDNKAFDFPDADLYEKQIGDGSLRGQGTEQPHYADIRGAAANKWNQQAERGQESGSYRPPYSYGYIHLAQDGAGFDPKTPTNLSLLMNHPSANDCPRFWLTAVSRLHPTAHLRLCMKSSTNINNGTGSCWSTGVDESETEDQEGRVQNPANPETGSKLTQCLNLLDLFVAELKEKMKFATDTFGGEVSDGSELKAICAFETQGSEIPKRTEEYHPNSKSERTKAVSQSCGYPLLHSRPSIDLAADVHEAETLSRLRERENAERAEDFSLGDGYSSPQLITNAAKNPTHHLKESVKDSTSEMPEATGQDHVAGKVAEEWKSGAVHIAEEAKDKALQLKDAASSKVKQLKRASAEEKGHEVEGETRDIYEPGAESLQNERRASDGQGYIASLITATKDTVVDAASAIKDKAAEAYYSVTEPAADKKHEDIAATMPSVETKGNVDASGRGETTMSTDDKTSAKIYRVAYQDSAPDGSWTSSTEHFEAVLPESRGELGNRSSTPNRSQHDMSSCAKDHADSLEEMDSMYSMLYIAFPLSQFYVTSVYSVLGEKEREHGTGFRMNSSSHTCDSGNFRRHSNSLATSGKENVDVYDRQQLELGCPTEESDVPCTAEREVAVQYHSGFQTETDDILGAGISTYPLRRKNEQERRITPDENGPADEAASIKVTIGMDARLANGAKQRHDETLADRIGKVIRLLGEGGFGAVFQVQSSKNNEMYAAKLESYSHPRKVLILKLITEMPRSLDSQRKGCALEMLDVH